MTTQPAKRPTVYIVQDTPGKNIFPAGRFGDFKTLFPVGHQIMLAPEADIERLFEQLRDFSDEDYLLLIGDPVAIGLATAVAADINGTVRFLRWNRQEADYEVVTAPLF